MPRIARLRLDRSLAALALVGLVGGSAVVAATQEPTPDPRSQLEAADRAYNAAAEARDRDALGRLLADDAVFFAETAAEGRAAFLEAWAPLWTGKYDFTYRATHLESMVSASGTLGVTLGEVETRFQRPGLSEPNVTTSHYLHVWERDGETSEGVAWRLRASSALVVHPRLGAARDPRSGLMTAWPRLADQIGSTIALEWTPETVVRAPSDDLAFTLGMYSVRFADTDETQAGDGRFLAVWTRDDAGHWQLAAEGFTPPSLSASPAAEIGR